MIGYPYIIDLFTQILAQSHAIEGRFYVSYRYGAQEINLDQLGEVITAIEDKQKYPLVIMVLAGSNVIVTEQMMEWEHHRIIMFFMKTSFYDSKNQTISPNPRTRTSTHTIPEDWHDMKRVAVNFLRQLDHVCRHLSNYVRVPKNIKVFKTMSPIGSDRATGVRLDFDFSVYLGCELEDYDSLMTDITVMPDSHPEHAL